MLFSIRFFSVRDAVYHFPPNFCIKVSPYLEKKKISSAYFYVEVCDVRDSTLWVGVEKEEFKENGDKPALNKVDLCIVLFIFLLCSWYCAGTSTFIAMLQPWLFVWLPISNSAFSRGWVFVKFHFGDRVCPLQIYHLSPIKPRIKEIKKKTVHPLRPALAPSSFQQGSGCPARHSTQFPPTFFYSSPPSLSSDVPVVLPPFVSLRVRKCVLAISF